MTIRSSVECAQVGHFGYVLWSCDVICLRRFLVIKVILSKNSYNEGNWKLDVTIFLVSSIVSVYLNCGVLHRLLQNILASAKVETTLNM